MLGDPVFAVDVGVLLFMPNTHTSASLSANQGTSNAVFEDPIPIVIGTANNAHLMAPSHVVAASNPDSESLHWWASRITCCATWATSLW